MKLLTYLSDSGPRAAALRDDKYVDLNAADPTLPHSLRELLARGAGGLKQAATAAERGEAIDPESVRLMPPIPDAQKILCIGLNYADHAKETGAKVDEHPVVFNKFPTTLRAHGDPIELPPHTDKVDYEAELVAVIGKAGRDISRDDALTHVAGYTCGHDVSARDWQKQAPGKQWLLGKTFDSFAPCGPYLVTADELGDASDLKITMRINGETLQDSNTGQLIFTIDRLIERISKVCTLLPGDLIFTGTPSGVGAARTPARFLKEGDVAEVEIERIGVLRNPVKKR